MLTFNNPLDKVFAVHSLRLHSIPLTLPLRFSNASFHFGFVHFTPKFTVAQNPSSFPAALQLPALNHTLLSADLSRPAPIPRHQSKNSRHPRNHYNEKKKEKSPLARPVCFVMVFEIL